MAVILPGCDGSCDGSCNDSCDGSCDGSCGDPWLKVGEWSLATDNCAMWLNGFQDNLPGFPQVFYRHLYHHQRWASLVLLVVVHQL